MALPRRRSAVQLLETFRRFYGPTMNAFEAASKDFRERELAQELRALFVAQNKGGETNRDSRDLPQGHGDERLGAYPRDQWT